MTKMTITLHSGIIGDNFDVTVSDESQRLFKERYYFDKDVAKEKEQENAKMQYVSNLLQAVVDEFQVTDVSVRVGSQVFDSELSDHNVSVFQNKYCEDLFLYEEEKTLKTDDLTLSDSDLADLDAVMHEDLPFL